MAVRKTRPAILYNLNSYLIYAEARASTISATRKQISAFRRNVASSPAFFSALGSRRPETAREASSVKSTC